MGQRRAWAVLSLLGAVVAVVVAIVLVVDRFPRALLVIACFALAVLVTAWALVREKVPRTIGLVVGLLLLIAAVVIALAQSAVWGDLVVLVAAIVSLEAARRAFVHRPQLPRGPRPQRAVLFYNPKSGGGKAERFNLADEARARGIEPRELKPGEDLVQLAEDAVRAGADALAMAGGDGSQAIVAAAAAKHGLLYSCIPAGTRNHFALDLGVDRDDVVGALEALVDGRERVVDLAEVNGRVFVNNVSLGIYADAVQESGYRDAKIRTLLATAPETLGDGDGSGRFRWTGPDGEEKSGAAVLLVSNDPYRLGRAIGSGTRPRLDLGELGIASVAVARGGSGRPVDEWHAATFEVRADGPVAVGVDGEALRLEPPLEFRSRPAALRVLIAPAHPGASPSAALPETPWDAFRALFAIAAGRG